MNLTPEQAIEYGILKTQVGTVRELIRLADRDSGGLLPTEIISAALLAAETGFKAKALALATELLA